MRLAILSLFLCGGMMAYCQSTVHGSASSDKQKAPRSASTRPDFGKLLPSWQAGITGSTKTFTLPGTSFFRQGEKAQSDLKMRFHWSQAGTEATIEFPLLAENVYPSRPSILSQWPNLKIEPIPTQWLNAKAEPIPSQWPNLKVLPIDAQSGTPGAVQASAK